MSISEFEESDQSPRTNGTLNRRDVLKRSGALLTAVSPVGRMLSSISKELIADNKPHEASSPAFHKQYKSSYPKI